MEFQLEEELVYDEVPIQTGTHSENDDGKEHSAADTDDGQDTFFNEEIR